MKSKYLLAALAATVATPAMAQNFDGPRVEARAGYNRVNFDAEVDGESGEEKAESVSFGGELGFDAMMGTSFVLGGYVGADFGSAELCEEVLDETIGSACVDQGRNFTIGARAGVPIGQSVLVYAKGGYSNSRIEVSFDEDVTVEDDEISASDNLDGFHIGAGLELAAGPNIYVKAEYVYTMYNGYDGDDDEDLDGSFDIDRHQGLIGVGFRF